MSDQSLATGLVFDIQRFAIHDGPGIRTIVFLKGCPLRCQWCSNPESQSLQAEIMYHAKLCVGCQRCEQICQAGAHSFRNSDHVYNREVCRVCGACVEACPTHALELSGCRMKAAEVMEITLRDKNFYQRSGGGLTLSGGEPLLQLNFAEALLRLARAEGIKTVVETTGYLPWPSLAQIKPLVDLFLYDLKETDEDAHRQLTGVPLAPIVENLRQLLAAGAKVRLRCPLVPGINDRDKHFQGIAKLWRSFPTPLEVEVVPYHRLGLAKYRALGRELPLEEIPAPTREQVEDWETRLRALGIEGVGYE